MITDEQRRVLKRAPLDAKRVQVKDAEGNTRWRLIPGQEGPSKHVLQETDTLVFKKDGEVSYMLGTPGVIPGTARKPRDKVVQAIVRDKSKHMKKDPLLRAVHADPESIEVLHESMKVVAAEVASLEFERTEAERKGESTATISNRRIAATTQLVNTWLKRKEQILAKGLDLESTAFQEVFGFICETFRDAMKRAEVPHDKIQIVFTKFGGLVEAEDWKAKARQRMKQEG